MSAGWQASRESRITSRLYWAGNGNAEDAEVQRAQRKSDRETIAEVVVGFGEATDGFHEREVCLAG